MTNAVNSDQAKEALRTWLRLLSSEALIEQRLRSVFRKEFNVTLPQFDVLSELEHASRPLTMSELSNELMVSNGNITGVVDRLVTMGLIRRERSEKDRRIQFIELTQQGTETFLEMAARHEEWINELMSELSLREMKDAQKLLLKIRHSVIENSDKLN